MTEEYYYTLNTNDLNEQQFLLEDFRKSGINDETINDYVLFGYFHGLANNPNKQWQLFYPEFNKMEKSDYYTIRYNTDIIPNFAGGKYERSFGVPSRLFRPLHLQPEVIADKQKYLIITEGEKKAIKTVQEGFPCVALAGVWCWKTKPKDEALAEDLVDADIIPDIKNADFKDKTIYLCFDNDMWEKTQVKNALYNFAAYLISEKGAIVKIIYLPKKGNEKLGIDDFLIKYGAEEFKKLINDAESLTLKQVQSKLNEEKPAPKFPIKIFSKELRGKIMDIQQRLDAPLPYVASLLISMSSVLMIGKYEIIVNKASDWIEHPIIWMSIVGEPSQKKTPCLKLYKKLINKIQKGINSLYETKLEEYKRDKEMYKKELKDYNNSKEKNTESTEIPLEPKKPKKLLLMTQNTTIEALYRTLKTNNFYNRLLSIVLDELAEFINSLGQYKKKSGDSQFILQSWSYDENYSVQRASGDNYDVQLGLSIIGTIQPKVMLKTIFADGLDSTDGFPQRWLFVTSDYKTKGLSEDNTPMDLSLIENIFNNLYSQEIKVKYCFSCEAQEFFNERYSKLLKEASKQNSELLKTYLEKMPAYIARFALILHCLENQENPEIGIITLKKAIELAKYFGATYHQIAIKLMNTDPVMDKAWEYIQVKGLKEITPTKLRKANKSLYRDAELILEKLASKGYGRLMKSKNGGSKFIVY